MTPVLFYARAASAWTKSNIKRSLRNENQKTTRGKEGHVQEQCMVYTEYVEKKYGKLIVVFDGYSGTSTKDMTHQRWSKGQNGVTVTFTEEIAHKKEGTFSGKLCEQAALYQNARYPAAAERVYSLQGMLTCSL